MKQFEILIVRPKRLFIGILIISISLIFSLIISSKQNFLLFKISIPILFLIASVGVVYYFSFGKLYINLYDNQIFFTRNKTFNFSIQKLNSIKIKEIKRIVVDPGYFIKSMLVNNKEIKLNVTKPLKKESKMFLASLIQQIKNNNGEIITSYEYSTLRGSNDLTFKLFIIFLSFSFILISRLWDSCNFKSLFLLFVPIIFYYIHVKQRIKKKLAKSNMSPYQK